MEVSFIYKKNMMREYIKNSELRVLNNRVKVRLSKELAAKYDNGDYHNCLERIE